MELCLDKSALLREILISGKRPRPRPRPHSNDGPGMCDQAMVKNRKHFAQTHRHRLWTVDSSRRYLFDAFECDKWDSISSV